MRPYVVAWRRSYAISEKGTATLFRRNTLKRARLTCVETDDSWDLLERVWDVTEGECYFCATTITPHTAELDHLRLLSRGGPHIFSNLRYACEPCNRRKGTMTADEFTRQELGG